MAARRSKPSAAAARRRKAKLRTWRGKIDLAGAVVAGPEKISEIVYCYRFPSRPGRIKIGYSSRGLARVAEQSTAFPETPELVFVIHHPRARQMEEAFHIALADRQADVPGTEWFDADLNDVLKVSPILRRATGRERGVRRLKWAASGVLVLVGLVMLPATMAGCVAVSEGVGVLRTLLEIGRYPEQILTGDLAGARETAAQLWSYAMGREASILVRLAGLLHIPVLAALPWRRWRRQAA